MYSGTGDRLVERQAKLIGIAALISKAEAPGSSSAEHVFCLPESDQRLGQSNRNLQLLGIIGGQTCVTSIGTRGGCLTQSPSPSNPHLPGIERKIQRTDDHSRCGENR